MSGPPNPSRIRVGVPMTLLRLPKSSGVGRMWHSVLHQLASDVTVGFWKQPSHSLFRQPPDVWLSDGHHGPLGVPEPSIVHLQEASWHEPSMRPMFEPWFLERYETPSRMAAEGAAAVITPSESSRLQIIEQYDVDPARVHTVPLGVDLALFRPARPGASEVIARAGGDPARPYVVFVSTLHPRKNLGALRRAMAGLARRDLPHSLVIAASAPPDRDDSTALFREAGADLPGAPGRVTVLSGLTDVELAAVVAGADAFCLPSLMEGFGLTALEAMACGVPVVVSNRGSLPEVVGQAGIVTEPAADALEAALFDLLSDPAEMERLSRAGLERSLRFTWDATARGWLNVLRQVVPVPRVSPLERLVPATGLAAQVVQHGIRVPVKRRRSIDRGS